MKEKGTIRLQKRERRVVGIKKRLVRKKRTTLVRFI